MFPAGAVLFREKKPLETKLDELQKRKRQHEYAISQLQKSARIFQDIFSISPITTSVTCSEKTNYVTKFMNLFNPVSSEDINSALNAEAKKQINQAVNNLDKLAYDIGLHQDAIEQLPAYKGEPSTALSTIVNAFNSNAEIRQLINELQKTVEDHESLYSSAQKTKNIQACSVAIENIIQAHENALENLKDDLALMKEKFVKNCQALSEHSSKVLKNHFVSNEALLKKIDEISKLVSSKNSADNSKEFKLSYADYAKKKLEMLEVGKSTTEPFLETCTKEYKNINSKIAKLSGLIHQQSQHVSRSYLNNGL